MSSDSVDGIAILIAHDAAREQFHEPPEAAAEPVTDPMETIEPRNLFAHTMARVHDRIERIGVIRRRDSIVSNYRLVMGTIPTVS